MSPRRSLVLTPGLTGADGIAGVSRLVVRALQPPGPRAGDASVEVLSLADATGPSRMTGASAATRRPDAGRRRRHFIGRALRAAVGAPPPSIVFCLHLRLSPVGRFVARGRARLGVFLHGIEAWRALGRMERWALERADLLVANSEHTARRFRAANPGMAHRPISVCHLGVADVPRSGAGPASAVASPFALIVGRLAGSERYKGHDLLIDLWPRVCQEVPDAHLVVAGDGDDRTRLEDRAAALGDRVRFLGHVSDEALADLHRRSAFFVMPSRDEGFGLVFLEAMRAGKACIGGAGAAAEVIEDGVTGLVVDAAEPDQVVTALARLFLEPDTRARMGQAGAERVAREFTEAHFRRRFRAIAGLAP